MNTNAISTTPNQLIRGELLSGYQETVLEISNGNWIPEIKLPDYPMNKNRVVIHSSATRGAIVQLSSGPLNIETGNQYVLTYNEKTQEWDINVTVVNYLTPKSVGSIIPDNPQILTYYSMDNCNYVAEVTLPAMAEDGAVIILSSTACKASLISDDNILYGGAKTIKPGEQSIYRYKSTCSGGGWVVDQVSIEPQDTIYDELSDSTTNVSDIDENNEIADSNVRISIIDNNNRVDDSASNKQEQSRETRSISNTLFTTPHQLGDRVLPSGYDEVVFELSDDNWIQDIILPLQPTDRSRVVIKSSANLNTYLQLTFTELKIETNSEYLLEYRSDVQQWDVKGGGINYLTPESVGNIIPDDLQGTTYYNMDCDNLVPEITLPPNAEDESVIIIRSTAISDSKVSAEHLLYASTTTIKSGDQYVFKYLNKFNRWVIESAPIRDVAAGNIQDEIPYPTSQTTLVTITDNSWRETIKLPEKAADRDKITLKSSTDAVSYINADNVNEPGVMKLQKGEQYDFFYIAENGKWQLVQSPDTLYQAQDITDGKVPELRTPRTIINAANGNYQPELRLPTAQQPGSRVIITSSAEWDISVVADETNEKVFNGETVVFKVDGKGLWFRETVTIDLLLLYSDKAADRLGKEVMEARLTEGLALTNKALENSGANFRYRAVDIRQVAAKAHWRELGHPLNELREDLEVQGWRNTLKADGIYYEGTEDGCGLAWLGPSEKNMVGTGSTNCGTTVMRHELGHNMGIYHGGETESECQGYLAMSTAMAGNAVNRYSNSDTYDAKTGAAYGIINKVNAVGCMNKISAGVAAYR
ncbi:hypothetical protein [Yersinia aleksiciae]|uniref:hypothetical protein n=1 Tax=Yersinia aleksiciae TaxID=263819 RepID=UPI0011A7EDC8|nr:hypothetical protein [Yersinia aleksiciae]